MQICEIAKSRHCFSLSKWRDRFSGLIKTGPWETGLWFHQMLNNKLPKGSSTFIPFILTCTLQKIVKGNPFLGHRKMEVSDTSSFWQLMAAPFLLHSADLQMRSQAVLRAPRQTDRKTRCSAAFCGTEVLWNSSHPSSSVDLEALRHAKAEAQAALYSLAFWDVAPLSSLRRTLYPREGWDLKRKTSQGNSESFDFETSN